MIQLPIEIGDIIRVGRFKNKKITVKEIGVDENNHPTINGRGILKVRIEKLMPKKEIKESMTTNEIIKGLKDGKYYYPKSKSFEFQFKGPYISYENGVFNWHEGGFITHKDKDISKILKENIMLKPNKAKLDKMILRLIKEEYPLGKIEKSFEFLEDKNPIKVKFQEKNGRHWIIQEESENVLGSAAGYETKDTARQSALILGFNFEGVEDMQGKVPEIPKLTKAKPVKYDKPEEVKLDKEKELKMEILRIAKRVIKEELSQKTQFYAVTFDPKHPDDVYNLKIINARNNREALWKYAKFDAEYKENNIKQIGNNTWTYRDKSIIYIITSNQNITAKKIVPALRAKYKLGEEFSKKQDNLKEDFPLINLTKPKFVSKKNIGLNELEVTDPEVIKKMKEMAEMSDQLDRLKAQMQEIEAKFKPLNDEFTQMLEQIDETKERSLRAENILISIKRMGGERTDYKYKEAYLTLLQKVNGKMKKQMEDFLEFGKTLKGEAIKSTTRVKSSIGVQKVEINESGFWSKIKNFFNKALSIFKRRNQEIDQDLDKLESMF